MNNKEIEKLAEKLERCRKISLDEVNQDEVDEITDIKIDKRKQSGERILDFLNKVKNPYIFKVNGKLVRIRFSDTNKTANDCLTNVLKNLYDLFVIWKEEVEMSGRGNKKLSRKNDENRRWHIGVYGRRSFDDGENSESYTIKNQKALIESFLENKANIEIEDYYIDDGYTGTNFVEVR